MDSNYIRHIKHIIMMLILITAVSGNCEPDSEEFNGKCYFASSTMTDWGQASTICQSRGGSLATVNSAEEQAFIRQVVQNVHGADKNSWIGGNDINTEGDWRWSSTNQVISYGDWYPGWPDGGSTENCLLMLQYVQMKWVDQPCGTTYNYVCEKVATGKETTTTTEITTTTTNPTTTTESTTITTIPTTTQESTITTTIQTTTQELTTTTTHQTTTEESTTTTQSTFTVQETTTDQSIIPVSSTSGEDTTATTGNSLVYTTTSGPVSTNLMITTIYGQDTSMTTQNNIISSIGTTSSASSSAGNTCTCGCQSTYQNVNWTKEAIAEVIQELRDKLLIPKNSTGMALRKLKCADDDRPSARTVGFIGIVLLSVVFGLLILADVQRVMHFLTK